jgi:hypothetical protein
MGNPLTKQNQIQFEQTMALQMVMMQTQKLLLEQKRIATAIAQEEHKLLQSDVKPNVNEIEYKPIEASYEIVHETEEDKKMTINTDTDKSSNNEMIIESIKRQIANDKEVPYIMQGRLTVSEDEVVVSPVVFTVRNDLWRERVRYALKESYYNEEANTLIREEKQTNNDSVFVILYNAKCEAVEMLMIGKIPINQYCRTDKDVNNFSSIYNQVFGDLKHLALVIKNNFNIPLDHYFAVIEPELTKKSPYVIAKYDDKSMMADVMKIKPLLSLDIKEQRITFDTYYRGIFRERFHV